MAAASALCATNALPQHELERCKALSPEVRDNFNRGRRLLLELMETTASQFHEVRADRDTLESGNRNAKRKGRRFGDSSEESEADGDESSDDDTHTPARIALRYRAMVRAVDVALDRANEQLDKAQGIRDASLQDDGLQEKRSNGPRGGTFKSQGCVALDIPKPQLLFPDFPIDNSEAPFVPARDPAACAPRLSVADAHLEALAKTNPSRPVSGDAAASWHPFSADIAAATERMKSAPFDPSNKTLFVPLSEDSLHWIDTEEQLLDAAEKIRTASAIAVDLEHHSVRSFQGFTCLIQISTRSDDYIVDAIALRGSVRTALGSIFEDPSIVKVFHGGNSDVQWLERDFSVYVVNMFDTGQAARLLQFSSFSLAYLLKRFAGVESQSKKKFQTADWRQRPLPEAMLAYARSDTHYLLYIFDRIQAELHQQGRLSAAWEKSAVVSRTRYVKETYDSNLPLRLAAKHGLASDPRQLRILIELDKWRDQVARDEDESVGYVMSNRMLTQITRWRDKARCPTRLRALLEERDRPVSPLMFGKVVEISALVSDALDASVLDTPDLGAVQTAASSGGRTHLLGVSKHLDRLRTEARLEKPDGDADLRPDSRAQEDDKHAGAKTRAEQSRDSVTSVALNGKLKETVAVKQTDSSHGSGKEPVSLRGRPRRAGPKIRVAKGAGRSLLLSSSSEESEGETAELSTEIRTSATHRKQPPASRCESPETAAAPVSQAEPRNTPAVGPEFRQSPAVDATEQTRVVQEVRNGGSLFDLDSSSSDDEATAPAVTTVMASLERDVREATARSAASFERAERNAQNSREEQARATTVGASCKGDASRSKTPKVSSMRERYEDRNAAPPPKKPRLLRKPAQHSMKANGGAEFEAYDYAAAKTKDSSLRKPAAEDVYKPLAKLLNHKTNRRVAKRTKKNPKSGERSMSFRPSR